jgi:hypothetical protein
MSARCAKTDTGRTEIRSRALPLTRTARNLLVIIDASKAAAEWVALVHGATQADLDGLLERGLVEPLAATVSVSARPAGVSSPSLASSREALHEAFMDALNGLTYGELYTLLTDQARARFGLIKGYRMVLEIERASGLADLQALAQRFVTQLREEHGEASLKDMRQALELT